MARSRKRANNSPATIWSKPRISTPHSEWPLAFPAPKRARSRSGRSWFIARVIPGHRGAMNYDAQLHIGESRHSGSTPRRVSRMTERSRMTLTEIEKTFRDEAGRALATLIRLVGDFDLAQDALQDAFAVALERWPASGLPSNPRAWLVNVGRNKAIDRVRRNVSFRDKQEAL